MKAGDVVGIRLGRWLGWLMLIGLTTIVACQSDQMRSVQSQPTSGVTSAPASVTTPSRTAPAQSDATTAETLVDIETVSPTIVLDMRYATDNNFLRQPVYSQARCLLRRPVAQQLAQVQSDLEPQGLGLKVFDCYRPLSVQRQMWAILPDARYIADPARGSRHNRGAAVDVSLVDRATGKALEMPTEFDAFTDQAHIDNPDVSVAAKVNRQRLRAAFERRGFTALVTEWWHFDAKNWSSYDLLDIALDTGSQE
jgi:D-alanyl-D-alanine dipeptidase